MATKDDFLPEKIIQDFEEKLRTQGEASLIDLLRYIDNLPVFFIRMLRSYRRAARVANAAWRYIELCTKEPSNTPAIQCTIEDMQSALSDYAPAYFPQPAMETVHIAELLERLYNAVCGTQTREEANELIYTETLMAMDRLNAERRAISESSRA
jgi:hypothetical protein